MTLWLTHDEKLVVMHQTIQTGVRCTVTAYEVTNDSHRLRSRQDFALNSDGSINEEEILVGPALLESVAVQISAGTVIKGQVAIGAKILRENGSEELLSLVSKVVFPSSNYPAQILFDPSQQSEDEGWYSRLVVGSNPAAGAECSDTVPTGVNWILRSARLTLTTDATVANRRVKLRKTNGGTVVWNASTNNDITASLTVSANFFHHAPHTAINNGDLASAIPRDAIINSGEVLASNTTNLQAGDNYASPVYDVLERLTLAS